MGIPHKAIFLYSFIFFVSFMKNYGFDPTFFIDATGHRHVSD